MAQTSNYLDLTALANDLYAAADNITAATQDLLEAAGREIEAEAKSIVPVRTGALKDSITMQIGKLRVTVGPAQFYGPFVEYGTGSRGEFPTGAYTIKPKNAQVLSFMVGGKRVFARSVRHPGIRARPYMRPAAQHWVDSLGRDSARVGVMLIAGHNPRDTES